MALLLPREGFAQEYETEDYDPDEVPTATQAFAIESARVVQAPGQVLESATVVVRDGLIERVGQGVEVPYDAERIAGDSLVVYAGFVDGLSHAGIAEKEEGEEQNNVERPGDPPSEAAGIQPQRTARSMLDPAEDASIEKLREAGFTAAHVVPEGEMLPGRGAIILLSGPSSDAMILEEAASLFAQFEGAEGVYPATAMAVIATLRQLYHEAERRENMRRRYEKNPQGLPRTPYDDVHAAFLPVIEGEQPLFFYTEDVLDIHRATSLQEDLGFPLALAGLEQSFEATETLQAADAPLFLTLGLPEEPESEESDTTAADTVVSGPVASIDTTDPENLGVGQDTSKAITPEAPGSAFIRDFRTRSYEDTDDEHENLLARQRLLVAQYDSTAGTLREAGLRFGFTTLDVKPGDVHDTLRRMIEAGLSEEDALAALTTDAAELLGLSQRLGTVEEGKIANLVVTDAPYFDEDTQIRYVFVDGKKFAYDASPQGSGEEESGETANPAGTWEYEVETPQGEFSGTLEITGSPGDLTGTITGPQDEETDVENIQLGGSQLSFEFEDGEMGTISVTATLSGDDMEGTMTLPQYGAFPLTGTRTSTPD